VNTNVAKNALDGKGSTFGKSDSLNAGGMSSQQFAKKAIRRIYNKENDIIIAQFTIRLVVPLKAFCPTLFYWFVRKYSAKASENLKKEG